MFADGFGCLGVQPAYALQYACGYGGGGGLSDGAAFAQFFQGMVYVSFVVDEGNCGLAGETGQCGFACGCGDSCS
ncbi:Uncharacterised protein [Neisseria meningitidis]|nr:Uncharacterised protein [Neisseria meningitidis]CKL19086.1 Uncharacterised protein [Neisseria meningitidis]CKL21767.1 Uncharacterised protein [Neisseria meningitidis]